MKHIKRSNIISRLENFGEQLYYGKELSNDFDIVIYDLIYSMEWIDKRINYVSQDFIRQELLSIKKILELHSNS